MRVNLERYRDYTHEPEKIARNAARYLRDVWSVTSTPDSDIPDGQMFGPPRMLAPALVTPTGAVMIAAGAVDDTPHGYRIRAEYVREELAAWATLEHVADALRVPKVERHPGLLDSWACDRCQDEVLALLGRVR